MTISNGAAEHRLPDYVRRRMDGHYVTRIEQLLGGEHPHAWQQVPPQAIFLAGNDYLCLAGEPALVLAQMRTMQAGRRSGGRRSGGRHPGGRHPGGQGELLMSAVYLQEGSAQHRLEAKLAAFMQAEDGILTQSGWAANTGLVQCLAAEGVPVYLDLQAHASLWEGVQSAGARPLGFLHNDMEHLERQLNKHGGGVIAVDAVYSTDGSVAPLAELVALAERHGCVLIVDESHSLGTHGPGGAGLVVACGLQHRVHFRTASLAKAFAGRAGFITCSSRFKGYFLSESRPAIFSSCLLSHELAWFDAAIGFIAAADLRRAQLHGHARRLRAGLEDLGYRLEGSEQIVALEPGSEPRTLALRKALERHGVFGAMFCAPATARNRALVRLTLNAGLSQAQMTQLLSACAAVRAELDLASWSSTRRGRRLLAA